MHRMTRAVRRAIAGGSPLMNVSPRLGRAKPVAWYDMGKPVYQTASGYTLAASNGDTVGFVPDQSGYGHHLRATPLLNASATPCTLATAAQNARNGVAVAAGKILRTENWAGQQFARGLTILAVVSQTPTTASGWMSFDVGTTLGLTPSTGTMTFSNNVIGAQTAQYPADVSPGIVVFRYGGMDALFGWNGQYVARSGNPARGSTVIGPKDLGLDPTVAPVSGQRLGSLSVGSALGSWTGTVFEVVVFAGALPQVEIDDWYADLNTRWAVTAAARRIACVGNSITWGVGAGAQNSYPTQLQALLGTGYQVCNWGIPSQTTTQMITGCPGQELSLARQGLASADIAVMLEVGNDVILPPFVNSTTGYANVVANCGQLRAAGFKVVVCTCFARLGTGSSGATTTTITAINTLIRTNWATFADAIADLAANANLSDSTNTTYFQADNVHLTTAGYGVVAGLVQTALSGL